MPSLWQPEVGNLWGMCGEPRKRFPTSQSLYTSAFQAICGEWGENSKKDVTDLFLLLLGGVVQSGSLRPHFLRNARRFPNDFMFQLTEQEWNLISSQFVMTSRAKRPKSALPLAFTEHGALMLSSVLRSDVAVETSIKITRAFVAMRQAMNHLALPIKLSELEMRINLLRNEMDDILHDQNDINESTRAQLDAISTALAELQADKPIPKPRRRIGFV